MNELKDFLIEKRDNKSNLKKAIVLFSFLKNAVEQNEKKLKTCIKPRMSTFTQD